MVLPIPSLRLPRYLSDRKEGTASQGSRPGPSPFVMSFLSDGDVRQCCGNAPMQEILQRKGATLIHLSHACCCLHSTPLAVSFRVLKSEAPKQQRAKRKHSLRWLFQEGLAGQRRRWRYLGRGLRGSAFVWGLSVRCEDGQQRTRL